MSSQMESVLQYAYPWKLEWLWSDLQFFSLSMTAAIPGNVIFSVTNVRQANVIALASASASACVGEQKLKPWP